MRVIVIPDIHLKPWIFDRADSLLREGKADQAVCLMDIPDDFGKEFHHFLYQNTFDAAIRFARNHPSTLWCYGNHDLCYKWNQRESGFSITAAYLVQQKLSELENVVLEVSGQPIRYVQKIDHVLFCHGGLASFFVESRIEKHSSRDIDEILDQINTMNRSEIWTDMSPIWFRPQYSKQPLYRDDAFLQVVGHTPRKEIERNGNVISCDVFSTDREGNPFGTQEFLILDTENWTFTREI